MDNSQKTFCLLKLFYCNVEDFRNLRFGRHLMECCPQCKPHHKVGKFIAHSTEEGSSGSEIVEEKGVYRPIVYLDCIKEWNVNESLYVIGLSAWHFVKPYVSFFSQDLSVKMGTASPHLVHAPLKRTYLVWHMVEGFPHEEMGVAFEKTNKVWLRTPTRFDKTFQSLLMDVFGLILYKTSCTPHCGVGDFGSWNLKVTIPSSRLLFGVECDEVVATFFAGFTGYENVLSHQFTSNSIFQPNDTEMETEADDLVNSRSRGHEVAETASLHLGVCNAVDELSSQIIKEEIKLEPEMGPEVMPVTQVSHRKGIEKKLAVSAVKCPGCATSFHGSKSGLDALSHHILNSHRRHAKLYRHSLRFRAQAGHGTQSDRICTLRTRPNHSGF